MTKQIAWALVALVSAAALSARGSGLGIGDAAPKIHVKGFIKGDPVKSFDKGKVYVVEFWATWCAPCKSSIPHLSYLQKTHPAVTFIGVSVAHPELESRLGLMKFRLLDKNAASQGDALEFAKHLIDDVLDNDAERLDSLAWEIASKKKVDAPHAKLAVQAAERANQLSKGREPSMMDTLALAYFGSGDTSKALATEERAVKMAQDVGVEVDKNMQKHLDEFRAAAKK